MSGAEIATNLVVLVPEAEAVLEVANRRAAPGAELKAPAHITLVYPFMPAETLSHRSQEMAAFFAEQRPFDVELRVGWFGREVLLLVPTDPGELVELTEAVISRWPEYPYYGETYDVIDPHLALGFGSEVALAPIADLVEPLTPVRATVAEVTILAGPHEEMKPGPRLPPRALAPKCRSALRQNRHYACVDELSVSLVTGANQEQDVLAALRRLRSRYDLRRFEHTTTVRIERGAIPHSHPVLTLSDRYGGDDEFLLTTYLHEQLHWWSMECPGAQDGRDEAVYGRLETEYPLPLEPPDGCGDLLSNLIHLHVCWLELEAASMFLGRERAAEILRSLWYYRAIYRTVLENVEALGVLFNAEGMGLPPASNPR